MYFDFFSIEHYQRNKILPLILERRWKIPLYPLFVQFRIISDTAWLVYHNWDYITQITSHWLPWHVTPYAGSSSSSPLERFSNTAAAAILTGRSSHLRSFNKKQVSRLMLTNRKEIEFLLILLKWLKCYQRSKTKLLITHNPGLHSITLIDLPGINFLCAYLLFSTFCLHMQYAGKQISRSRLSRILRQSLLPVAVNYQMRRNSPVTHPCTYKKK